MRCLINLQWTNARVQLDSVALLHINLILTTPPMTYRGLDIRVQLAQACPYHMYYMYCLRGFQSSIMHPSPLPPAHALSRVL